MVFQTEWTIALPFLLQLWQHWFRPMVDLFATRFNHRLDVNMSPVPDPAAWRVDTLSFSLSNLLSYASPPPLSLLPKVFRKAGLDQATMILVASRWPDRPWFPGLLALMHVPPLKLHIGPKTLIQSRSGFPDGNPHVLDLHESLLRRACCLHQARLRKTLALVRDSHRPGTPSIYAALLTWCGKGFNSLRLLEEGHSASTIRGYRPAISALPP